MIFFALAVLLGIPVRVAAFLYLLGRFAWFVLDVVTEDPRPQ